jgi:hypothetical protein
MSVYNPAIGGGIIEFPVSQTNPWSTGTFSGVGLEACSAAPADLLPWPAPAAGIISDLACQGNAYNITGGTLSVTLYKAAGGASPTFVATTLSAQVKDDTAQGYDADPTHSFTVAAGDLVLVKLSGSGVWGSGQVVTALWNPVA